MTRYKARSVASLLAVDDHRSHPAQGENAMSAVTTARPVVPNEENNKTDRKAKKDVAKRNAKASAKTAPKPKRSQAEKQAEREERERKLDALLIVPLIKPSANPCKPGTFCFAEVAAALASKTVAEAKAKLAGDKHNPTPERHIEIAWMTKKGYIKTREA